jgi:hypothetical protein
MPAPRDIAEARVRPGRGSLVLVSPPALFLFVWALAAIIAAWVLARPEANDLAHLFIARHRLDLAAFAAGPVAWALLLSGALALGYAAAGLGLRGRPASVGRQTGEVGAAVAAQRLFWLNAGFLGVTALWVGLTMHAVGGIDAYLALAGTDALGARDLLLEGKLFTGMRLLYAALPATAALAAALLARGGHSRMTRRMCLAVVVLNLAALFLLTLVMSQRLLVLQLVVACYVAATVARGRLVALSLVPVAVLIFAAGWVAHEALTNPGLMRPAGEIAAQKFAFYMVNDLWNTVRPLRGDAPWGGGLFSFQFAFFFTLSDGAVYAAHAARLEALEAFRGGGEFSLLSAPFVDFGPLGGAGYLLLYGGVMRLLWHRSGRSAGDAAIYGQAATAILLSVHNNFVASQDFVFAVMVILAVTRLPAARARALPGRPHATV